MRPLPAGTLTLLFSDIEGSTSMLTGLGPQWRESLSVHRRILRAAFRGYGGREIGTEGDSFFVVFTSAQQAVLAALEAQCGLAEHEWPAGSPLRVRIGVHTGEPERLDDGYIGLDVHRAARIAATAHGGQIVVSEATHLLLGPAPTDMAVRDLGWHRLKDLPEPEHLYEVAPPGLSAEHPPLRSLGMPTVLPSYGTDLVGRSRELQEVTEAVGSGRARLVTFTGPGGTGKTRLAVAVASEVRHRFLRDVFFVSVHTADNAETMWQAIADAVDAPATADEPPRDRALRFLRDRSAFLVLDNLEQICDADAVVSALLDRAPEVSLLATSRRPMHLVDEHIYPVPPLTVPDGDADVAAAGEASAVRLFLQRAAMVSPGFRLSDENVADVVALCRCLDGLPLAIEIAAARCRLLSPHALLSRIDGWLGGSVADPHRTRRQQTLGATVAWSYDMLEERDQDVFRRLGVFAGPVGLEAVDSVVGSGARDPLDVVAHLVDVSLLEITPGSDGEPRVRMLETVRRFAREKLEQAGELDETRLRHARWCVGSVTEICALLGGPRQMTALDRMEDVEEEVREALEWSLSPADTFREERRSCGFALLEPMDSYWYRFARIAEGRAWNERALRLLDGGGGADDPALVDALHGHGVLAVEQNDLATGTPALERALEMAHRLGDLDREARECNSLGIACRERGDVERARLLIERSGELARLVGDPRREATALSNVMHLHMDTGDFAGAVEAARRAVAADEALGDPWGVAIDEGNLVTALLHAEGPEPAFERLVQVAPAGLALGDIELSIDLVDSFAAVWAAFGDAERAATMLGASERQRDAAGIPRPGPDQVLLDRFLVPARQATGGQEWERAYARGRTLTLEAAVEEGGRMCKRSHANRSVEHTS